MDLRDFIRDVEDFPEPGIVFKDITPLLSHGPAFRHAVDLFADRHRDNAKNIDRIVGIESRGFIFASALAYVLDKGVTLARKPGKLPFKSVSQSYTLEYGSNTLEMHVDAIEVGERVVVIDDLLATGGTMAATCDLIESFGADIDSVGSLIELTFLGGRQKLGDREFYSFIQY